MKTQKIKHMLAQLSGNDLRYYFGLVEILNRFSEDELSRIKREQDVIQMLEDVYEKKYHIQKAG